MDKLKELYSLYLNKGIISDNISEESFRNIDPSKRQALYDLGTKKGLFKTTDFNTFSTAWDDNKSKPDTSKGVKAEEESGVSVSPSASTGSSSELQPNGYKTTDEKIKEFTPLNKEEEEQLRRNKERQAIAFSRFPELQKRKFELEEQLKSTPIPASGDILKEIEEIDSTIDNYIPKSFRKIRQEKAEELDNLIAEQERKDYTLGGTGRYLENNGTYEQLKKERKVVQQDIDNETKILDKVLDDTSFFQQFGKFWSFGLYEPDSEKITVSDKLGERILLELDNNPKLKQKFAYGSEDLTIPQLEEREALVTTAKVKFFKEELDKINKESESLNKDFKTVKTEEEKQEIKNKYDNLQQNKNELLVEVGYDKVNNRLKDTFKKTEENRKYEESLSDSKTTDVLSTTIEAFADLSLDGLSSGASVLAMVGDLFDDDGKYGMFDALGDTASNFANSANLLPSSEQVSGKIINEDGSFNWNPYSVSKTLGTGIPFMASLALDARKGDIKGTYSKLAKYLNPKKADNVESLLRIGAGAYRKTITDNLEIANDFELEGVEKAVLANGLSVAEGLFSVIQPEHKFFSSSVGNGIKRNFIGSLKKAANKQAVKQASKDFFINIAKELGEENLTFITQEALKLSMVDGYDSALDELSSYKEIFASTVILSGGMGTLGLRSKIKKNKESIYSDISDNFDFLMDDFNGILENSKDPKLIESVNKSITFIGKVKEAVSESPQFVNSKQIDLLMKKKELVQEMQSVDKAFHPDYKEKIDKIDEDIRSNAHKSYLDEGFEPFKDVYDVMDKKPAAGKRLFNDPNPETKTIADSYKKEKGINVPEGSPITKLDENNSKEIADAFEEMKHDPNNSEVKQAYQEMAKETVEQYESISKAGYVFEIYEGKGEPYANSQEMIDDVKNNKHLYILSTENDFGINKITDQQRQENPLLENSNIKDINGKPLLINDIFRGVHDFFGHTERGNGFGAKGEENAWDVHARMYGDKARRAMTTETRGQNSWVNFGKQMRNEDGSIKKKGDDGYLSVRERPFAEQKIGLLPEKYSNIINNESNTQNQTTGEPQIQVQTGQGTEGSIKTGADTSNSGDVSIDKIDKVDLSKKGTLDKLINTLDNLDNQLKDFGNNTLGVNLPVVVARGAIKAMKAAAKTAKTGLEVLEAANKYVKSTQWYKNLSDSDKKEFDKDGVAKSLNSLNDPETQYNRNKEIAKKAREEASSSKMKVGERIKKSLSKFFNETVDRQGIVKKAITNMGGDKVVDYIVARAGASSSAKFHAEKAYNKIFKGLSNKEIENLEEIIQLKRTVAINDNRKSRGLEPLKRQGGMDAKSSKVALEGYKQKLGDKTYKKLEERAESYFKAYKKILSEMKEEGLITQETYELFAEVNYQPTQYLQFMEDMDGNFLMEELDQAENIPLSKEQIKSSNKGFEGSQVMDAWYLLQKSILTRSKAVFSNRLNNVFYDTFTETKKEVDELRKRQKAGETLTKKELKKIEHFENVESKVKLDEISGYTKTGNPKYKLEGKNTKGFSPLYFYKDGVKHRMLMEDKFLEQFTDTNNKYLNGKVRENIALATGTSMVKTLATGNNPLFFITNTPRDFLFTLTFSKEYGNEVISNSIKLGIDFTKGIRSVIKGDETFEKFLQYGGGMDYLSVQGKYKNKGLLKSGVDLILSQKNQDLISKNKFKQALDKFNMASEMGMRLAVFNKSIKNQLKDRGVKDIETLSRQEQNDIYVSAVRSARELSDFAQGGKTTKALDAAIPYLNAAVQGTRAATSNMKNRPVETMVRIAQVTGYSVGAIVKMSLGAIAYFRDDEDEEVSKMSNSEIYFETLRGVSGYDLQNYFIIPLGYKDDKGEWVYNRIAKSQSLTPFINAAEFFMRKRLADNSKIEYKQDLGKILKNTTENNIIPIKLNPIDAVASTPIVNATLAWYGIDGYTGNPLSWDRGRIPKELEGLVDKRVEPMFKEIGSTLDVSPIRLQEVTEAYITTPNTNPYIGVMYGLGNYVTSKETSKESSDRLKKQLSKSFSNRWIKSTSKYNRITKVKENVSKEVLDIYRKSILLENDAREIIRDYKKDKDKDKLTKDFTALIKSNPEKSKQLTKWLDSEINKKSLAPLVSFLKFEKNKEVRALILAERYGNSLLNHRQLKDNDKKVLGSLVSEKVLDTETYVYYKKIVSDD